MKKSVKVRVVEKVRSLRFRIFIVAVSIMMIPAILLSIFLLNMATNGYIDKKIDRFKSNNTMLKNSIVSEGYLENKDSESVNAHIEQLAREYHCRIEVINSQYQIVKDTDSSEIGKTSISENVIRSMKGENLYIENRDEKYVEFAIPLTTTVPTAEGRTKSGVMGVLYINYSIADMDSYRDSLSRYIVMMDCLLVIFALVVAWLCSFFFMRPLTNIGSMIKEISSGKTAREKEKDYTELAKISSDFKHMMDKMNTQDRSRQEFVSNVSHELKTPLTSMKVLAESLIGQQGMPEELYQEFLQDICKEIDRENDIIMDLLELVRMEKPETEINISSVNINEILETVLRRLKPIAENKNIELIFESFRPVIADVDEIKFASVATNLVENAIKYNNTDGTVTASLNSDHRYFYLTVTDTGIGISEEDQERVFERFFRVDKARARETGGTGLGLAITKDIVEKHHGSIKIHSKEGVGTTFTVRIPLKYIA